jgi:hypothetical protein
MIRSSFFFSEAGSLIQSYTRRAIGRTAYDLQSVLGGSDGLLFIFFGGAT